MPHSTRKIALIYDARLTYDLKVMAGVAAYMQEGHHYSVFIEENALKDQRLPDLRSWEGDGIIADFDDPAVARLVAQARLPAIGFGGGYGWYASGTIPYFYTNNKAISKLAADHLLDRGFKHFAYCGYAHSPINGWSRERQDSFVTYLSKRTTSCIVLEKFQKAEPQLGELTAHAGFEWLRKLPKPVGIMAANDTRGRQLLEACRTYGLVVPDEVAVVGVDNDELLCRLSSPPLSSVEQGAQKLGYAAAELLDDMMQGRSLKKRHYLVDPASVVTRQSTDVLAIDDPKVAQAMAFIRDHAADGIKVPDVVSSVAISRSGLEARFTSALDCSIHAAIKHRKLECARRLVSEDVDMPLKQIASETGFASVQHMTTLFVQEFGQAPGKQRRSFFFLSYKYGKSTHRKRLRIDLNN